MVAGLINDRYETLEQLGGGGQGRVYLALDHQHGRKVALKVRDLIGDDGREVLLREARMLLRLEPHRGLPIVREDFFLGDHYYLVMDWIEGTNLQRVLVNRGDPGLPADTVIGYIEQAAEALDHIHQHDPAIVHGDVKPDNLILGPKGRVSVVDFGIAVNRGAEASAGTQGYIAPEVGAGGPQTPASDIYALAATAFALLSGSPPEGDAPTWSGIQRIQVGNLEHALRLALSTNPDRRPATCKELVDRLKGWLEPEEPHPAGSPSPAPESAEGVAPGPGGVVTFLLTDIEGSTRLWEERSADAGTIVDRHEELIRGSVSGHHGVHLKRRGEGDSTFNVFTSAVDAVAAALEMQRSLTREPWSDGVELRVRVALHTGEAEFHGGDYLGTAVNRCARLRSIAHGGQVVLSAATAELIRDRLPEGAGLRSLGAHRLKDLSRPETVYQLEHPDLTIDFPALRSLEPTRHNLPAQRTTLIGREDVLERIRLLIDQGRLLTLTGVGGCGKTRLAIEASTEMLSRFEDGALFVDLAAVADPSLVWTALSSAVAAVSGAFGGSARPLRDDLIGFLQGRSALLVLDNCEDLAAACAELADDVLGHCPSVTILATSREPLGLEGEQAFVVPSLELPGDEDPERSASLELFVARASAARPEFELTAANLPSVVEICRRLDGIPLAIELAAALVAHMSAEQIADRLHERFRLLVGRQRRVQRQQTLQATMDWSYGLLAEPERTLLRRLAVFPGSFDLRAVEAICGMGSESVALMGALVARSLVGLREESMQVRYRLLETVRAYAQQQLAQVGESDAYRGEHRDHYLAVVNAMPVDDAFWSLDATSFGVEIDNLREALEWSAGEGRFDQVVRFLRVADAWNWRGAREDARRWLDLAFQHEAELEPEQRLELRAAADVATMWRIDVAALKSWARAEEWGTSELADRYILVGLYAEGTFNSWLNPAEAVQIAAEALRLAESGLPDVWSGAILGVKGDALMNLGDLTGAVEAYSAAQERSEPRAYPRWYAAIEKTIPLHMLGEHRPAREAANAAQGLQGQRTMGLTGEVISGCILALAIAADGDSDQAEDILAGLIERVRQTNMAADFESCIGSFGWVAAIKGEFERASRLLAATGGMYRTAAMYALHLHYVQVVRNALDTETAHRCRAEGSAMSQAQAFEEALRHAT